MRRGQSQYGATVTLFPLVADEMLRLFVAESCRVVCPSTYNLCDGVRNSRNSEPGVLPKVARANDGEESGRMRPYFQTEDGDVAFARLRGMKIRSLLRTVLT